MSLHWDPREQIRAGRYLLKWAFLSSVIGILAGSASALFLRSLEIATSTRLQNSWLLYCLPLAGLVIGLFYHYFWKNCEGGNNLLLDEIHKPNSGVPARMAPAILLSTVMTHLFGGSAGREGTAVQMGGSLAGWFGRLLGLDRLHTRILLMAGISAGFGAVFGTPLAGMVFGLEVLAMGRMRYDALVPCLVASVVGDWTCSAWGVHHTHYAIHSTVVLNGWLIAKLLLAALAFGLVSILFAELTSSIHWLFKHLIRWSPARPFVGGLLILGLVWLVGTRDYLGLGVPQIVQSFTPEGVAFSAFAWKLLFTAVTLGSGFKGGEVTPLFFMGATLGYTLGVVLGVPTDLMAALGFVAVFAGAANTPLACTIMGIELFGSQCGVYMVLACCFAYVWSGHRGIYGSQMVDTPKTDDPHIPTESTLVHIRERQLPVITPLSFLAHLSWRSRKRRHTVPPVTIGENGMKPDGRMGHQTVGLMRIYLASHDRRPGLTWSQRLFSRPLYQEIVDLAREAGVLSATAKGMHYGFINNGKTLNGFHVETGLTDVHIYVELIGHRDKLSAFHQQISPWIVDRVVVFKEVEHWTVSQVHVLPETAQEAI